MRGFYRTLGNAIWKINIEGNDWKTEIFQFLFQYRTTPHCSTKISPAELLQGRKLGRKIPFLKQRDSAILTLAKKQDRIHKTKMKTYADVRNRAKLSDISIGDFMMLKQRRSNKFTTNFNVKPYKVVDRKGNMVIIESNGKTYMRNVTFVKKIPNQHSSGQMMHDDD